MAKKDKEPKQPAEQDAPAEAKGRKADASRRDLPPDYVPRLLLHYRQSVQQELMEGFGYRNVMQVPRLEKIVVNMGLGEAVRDGRLIEIATRDLGIITGQKPVVTRARKSVASFKLREGMPIGAKVTLRGERMWEFCDRLVSVALPRIRDFRGLNPRGFDRMGNYTMGVNEQLIFPEIEYDKVERQLGMDITFVTTAQGPEEGYALLRGLGFPFSDAAQARAAG
jgi:large subunit ribosomal protein L5